MSALRPGVGVAAGRRHCSQASAFAAGRRHCSRASALQPGVGIAAGRRRCSQASALQPNALQPNALQPNVGVAAEPGVAAERVASRAQHLNLT
jgi:hypothetical protein